MVGVSTPPQGKGSPLSIQVTGPSYAVFFFVGGGGSGGWVTPSSMEPGKPLGLRALGA